MKVKLLSIKDLRTKKDAELAAYIAELQTSYQELIHALNTNKETKTHHLGAIKKSIARAKTIQTALSGEEK